MDWSATLLDPIYNSPIAVNAVLVLVDGDPPVTLRVLDITAGASVGREVQMDTIRPAADVRATELASHGLSPEGLLDSTLTLSSKDWTVKSFIPLPSPDGEASGEYRLLLEEVET